MQIIDFTDKRKVQEGERLKIEFKKDATLKKKQTIAEIYQEEVPIRKSKKEKERKEKAELYMQIDRDENIRNIQLKGKRFWCYFMEGYVKTGK